MTFRFLVAFAAMVLFTGWAHSQDVKFDPEKSKIDFLGKKTDGKHAGGFKEFEATAKVDWDEPANSTLAIEIKTDSLWSDDKNLTQHLRNPDFFDVKKYPTIKFESTEIDSTETEGTITGKLTMLGKTAELAVPVEVKIDDEQIVLIAKFKLDRTKWGMNYGRPKVDDNVEITANLRFKR